MRALQIKSPGLDPRPNGSMCDATASLLLPLLPGIKTTPVSDVPDTSNTRRTAMLMSAFGPDIATALADPAVIEVMVNPDGQLWLDRWSTGRTAVGKIFSPATVERIIRLVASHLDLDVGPHHPIISGELPTTGERFEGLLPPIADQPCFAVRKASQSRLTLMDFVTRGVATAAQAESLKDAVRAHKSILIAGGTSSGKTTLAGALLHELATTGERILILEDTRELDCPAADVVRLKTRPNYVTLRDLVRSTLRLRPDRIIIGEVRGGEALDLLKAWTTGHPGGIATVHAETTVGALNRLEHLAREASDYVPRTLIADAVELIVVIARSGTRRHITHIQTLHGLTPDGSYDLRDCDFPSPPLNEGD
jgi:type IV secretion system protein TrbB